MDKEKSKAMFLNLTVGDLVSSPEKKGEAIVLRSKEDGRKLLGTICGDHVHPLPGYIVWDEKLEMPVTTGGAKIFTDWTSVSVTKEGNTELAAVYANIPVEEDYLTEEAALGVEEIPEDVFKRVSIINGYSNTSPAIATVAMLREMGVTITDGQALLVHTATQAKQTVHLEALGNMFTSLGERLKGTKPGKPE